MSIFRDNSVEFSLGDPIIIKRSFYGYITKVATWSRPLSTNELVSHANYQGNHIKHCNK